MAPSYEGPFSGSVGFSLGGEKAKAPGGEDKEDTSSLLPGDDGFGEKLTASYISNLHCHGDRGYEGDPEETAETGETWTVGENPDEANPSYQSPQGRQWFTVAERSEHPIVDYK